MSWKERWRADLRRPEVATGREDLIFLAAAAAAIIGLAQWTDPGSVPELVLLLPALVAFVLRGVLPRLPGEVFAGTVLVAVVVVVGHAGHLEGTFFLVVLAVLYTSWHLGSTTRAVLILAAAVTAPWLVADHLVPGSGIGWTPWSAASVLTFALGRTLSRQRHLIEELERAREALATQAVAEERRRIARELHDLAGHTLAAVLLHVTGARHVLRRDLDEAERALRDAEAVGRASLDQIRATVRALRSDERGTDPALAVSADLVALAEEYRRAGLLVDLEIDPSLLEVTGPIGTALHRITRESLANVARHASDNRVRVIVASASDEVTVTVADHGRPADPPDPSGGTFGLLGMRERARALGGRLDAGPTADGWRVVARLPLRAVDRGPIAPARGGRR